MERMRIAALFADRESLDGKEVVYAAGRGPSGI